MASEQNQDGAPPSAAALAMNAALGDDDAAGHAHEYLHEQTRLTRLQIEDMQRDERLRVWSFRVRHISDVLWLSFQFAIAVIGLAIVIGLGAFVWNAASSNSLVIEAFSVPPSLAERGLTGQVVAKQLQDKLSNLQVQTNSMRASSSYENNWGNDIKVQIPETGVSIGELGRYLREWLGSETHITGEIFRDGSTVSVTARVGAGAAKKFSGKESDLDTLMQKAAEAVYSETQPYRYGVYLATQNRLKDAAAVFDSLVVTSAPKERAWAYIGLTTLDNSRGDVYAMLAHSKKAVKLRPDFILGWINVVQANQNLHHYDAELASARALDAAFRKGPETDINQAAQENQKLVNDAVIAEKYGDYQKMLAAGRKVEVLPDYAGSIEAAILNNATAYADMHDPAAVKRSFNRLLPTANMVARFNRDALAFVDSAVLGQWDKALAMSKPLHARASTLGPAAKSFVERALVPLTALANAGAGQITDAKAGIANTPPDCDDCTRVRIMVAEMAGNLKAAQHWARHLVAHASSSPVSYSDLGRVLLEKGDADGAITQLKIAHEKGPHFADPLVYWGEALMLKNRSDLALAKFAEASKDAPNWGRLHLKWGEALLWSGDKAGAQKQFAIAANLHLTPQEKSELAQMKKRAGKGTVQRT